MSRNLVDEQRIFGQLERSCSDAAAAPNARQMRLNRRLTESAAGRPSRAVLQCVASAACVPRSGRSPARLRVRDLARRPRAGLIQQPRQSLPTKRCRQRPTVCRVTPAAAAMSPLVLVDAHASTRRRALLPNLGRGRTTAPTVPASAVLRRSARRAVLDDRYASTSPCLHEERRL